MISRSLLSLFSVCPLVSAITEEYYTTNAVCEQRYCINPVIPGLDALVQLDTLGWIKYPVAETGGYLSFCKHFITYDFALPVMNTSHQWNFTGNTMKDRVDAQEQLASNLYFFHLSAMGLEAWDYPTPEKDTFLPHGPCVEQVARMACFTYLPMANPAVANGANTRYIKPCRSSCQNYVRTCQVNCCDDSVQCVFDRSGSEDGQNLQVTQSSKSNAALQIAYGYADYDGPSMYCTGDAPTLMLRVFVTVLASMSSFVVEM
jgi:hypothetical protein